MLNRSDPSKSASLPAYFSQSPAVFPKIGSFNPLTNSLICLLFFIVFSITFIASPLKAEDRSILNGTTGKVSYEVIASPSLASGALILKPLNASSPISEGMIETQLIESPLRLVIDLKSLGNAKNSVLKPNNSDFIKSLRIGTHPDKIRLVMDFADTISATKINDIKIEKVQENENLSIRFTFPSSQASSILPFHSPQINPSDLPATPFATATASANASANASATASATIAATSASNLEADSNSGINREVSDSAINTSITALPTQIAIPTATQEKAAKDSQEAKTLVTSETATPIATENPTTTATALATAIHTATATVSSIQAPSKTPTAAPTATATKTQTAIPTATSTRTATKTPTATATATATKTHLPTKTPTATPTATATKTQTAIPTATSTRTATKTPTATATATATKTHLPTKTPTATPTAAATKTQTAIPTATSTATATKTQEPSKTPTGTPTATATKTQSATITPTATISISPTPLATAALPILESSESRSADALASTSGNATSDLQEIDQILFEYQPPDNLPIVKVRLRQHSQFKLVKRDEGTFVISVPACKVSKKPLSLPQFPPQDFVGFRFIQASQSGSGCEILIGVDKGTRIAAFAKEFDILIRSIGFSQYE